jgi:lipopolysaccharide transport system ATP-binding protein
MQLVPADATIEVRFRIRCLLNPGTYFLNAGCLADTGVMEEYIDRRVDAAMFRVMPDQSIRATALVDLVHDDSIEWHA